MDERQSSEEADKLGAMLCSSAQRLAGASAIGGGYNTQQLSMPFATEPAKDVCLAQLSLKLLDLYQAFVKVETDMKRSMEIFERTLVSFNNNLGKTHQVIAEQQERLAQLERNQQSKKVAEFPRRMSTQNKEPDYGRKEESSSSEESRPEER